MTEAKWMDRQDTAPRETRPPYGVDQEGAPYPASEVFGFTHTDQVARQRHVWYCKFLYHAGRWFAVFLDGSGTETELWGDGDTARSAFESLVARWFIMNGGEAGSLLYEYLPSLRQNLDDSGLTSTEM